MSVSDHPPEWWVWCGKCGRLWAQKPPACEHRGATWLYQFPDPKVAHAAFLIGGNEAVYAIEAELFMQLEASRLYMGATLSKRKKQ